MDDVELKRVFQMFDKNGDGRITKEELSDSLEKLGIFIPDDELTQMIKKIDVNGDNCVDIEEFGELYQSLMSDKDEEEDMKEAFKVFDQNGDGYISVDELRSVLVSLGLKQGKTIEDCKKMIMKVDVDGDGKVNFMEFKQMMKGVDLDEGVEAIESFTGGDIVAVSCEADSIVEPHEGMEFESEDAAKIFYDEYARQVGFVMRVMSCRRSERDGRILARRLGCNKEGYCVSIRGKFGPVRKPRPITREGCKAMIHIKFNKSGKWVITRFIKEHNHPLVVAPREARQTMDEKDKKIQELTAELRNKKRLCVAYQEQLTTFMKIVEEHSGQLSKKVQNVVNNLKEYESIELLPLPQR